MYSKGALCAFGGLRLYTLDPSASGSVGGNLRFPRIFEFTRIRADLHRAYLAGYFRKKLRNDPMNHQNTNLG